MSFTYHTASMVQCLKTSLAMWADQVRIPDGEDQWRCDVTTRITLSTHSVCIGILEENRFALYVLLAPAAIITLTKRREGGKDCFSLT